MKILVVGGYGAFGTRLVSRLASNAALEICIAGRNAEKAKDLTQNIQSDTNTRAALSALSFDALTGPAQTLRDENIDIVVNASGPFQAQNTHLAKCAIAAQCHYIDLADAREFIPAICQLDQEARAANVAVISGASTVPALSSAVIAHYKQSFSQLEEIEIAISPGNHFNPGLATTASILSYVGKPIKAWRNGKQSTAFGWQDIERHAFGELGKRWIGNVDIPDVDLLPDAYPTVKTLKLKAGLEVSLFHLGLWSMSWLVRAKMIPSIAPLAGALLHMKQMLPWLGTDTGGMTVTLRGREETGQSKEIKWALVARNGDGPYIPTLAAQILCEQMAAGKTIAPGARACFDLLTLTQFSNALPGLDISMTSENA